MSLPTPPDSPVPYRPPTPESNADSDKDAPSRSTRNGKPKRLLLDVLDLLLTCQPELVCPLLLCGNNAVHSVAKRQAYRELEIILPFPGTRGEDVNDHNSDSLCCLDNEINSKLLTVMKNHIYGQFVRILYFRHPRHSHKHTRINSAREDDTCQKDCQEAWDLASCLVNIMPNVEELIWETCIGVGGTLWKAIGTRPRLRRLAIVTPPSHPAIVEPIAYPRLTPELQLVVPPGFENAFYGTQCEFGLTTPTHAIGRGGLSLGIGWDKLEDLSLHNLSASGARTLSAHFELLAAHYESHLGLPLLRTLSLATFFVDAGLCRSIGRFGSLKSLKHLKLSTTGTKLNAEGIKVMIEGCLALESFVLDEVEGRLDKNTWAMIEEWPNTLRKLDINIAETGLHHSWVLKHLSSIHCVPFSQLTRFSVKRVIHPIATLPWPPSSVSVPQTLQTHGLTQIPTELLNIIIRDGVALKEICIDWWQLITSDLEAILQACPHLKQLQVSVKAAMLDIVGMSTAFGNVPALAELSITSPEEYSTAAPRGRPSKVTHLESDLPLALAELVAEGDPALPEFRDLRKFVRRLPMFRVLRWIGRQGKGEWRFPVVAKKTTLTPIHFIHAAVLTQSIWKNCQSEPVLFDFEEPSSNTTQVLELPKPSILSLNMPSTLLSLAPPTSIKCASFPNLYPVSSVVPQISASSAIFHTAGCGQDADANDFTYYESAKKLTMSTPMTGRRKASDNPTSPRISSKWRKEINWDNHAVSPSCILNNNEFEQRIIPGSAKKSQQSRSSPSPMTTTTLLKTRDATSIKSDAEWITVGETRKGQRRRCNGSE